MKGIVAANWLLMPDVWAKLITQNLTTYSQFIGAVIGLNYSSFVGVATVASFLAIVAVFITCNFLPSRRCREFLEPTLKPF